ncbi:MAG: DUF5947 family protein [Kineosporiaceae bacterium]
MMASGGTISVLRRLASARAERPERVGERCEMCGQAIAEEHSHVVDARSRSLLCTCRACWLLFTRDDAALAYRAVPDRYLSFPGFRLPQGDWDELQIPVGIAFFLASSAADRTVAFYPSPAGATESELPLGYWDRIVAANPSLGTACVDVEAVLVRARDEGPGGAGGFDCWLVPIDACYELVGHLRRLWRGFDGGQEVRERLDEFFARIRSCCKPGAGASAEDGARP